MPQKGRVPQFGKWDSSDSTFTMAFEVARKDKGTGPKIIKPIDPEMAPNDMVARPKIFNPKEPQQNAEALKNGLHPKEHQYIRQGHHDRTGNHHLVKKAQGCNEAPATCKSNYDRTNMEQQRYRRHRKGISYSPDQFQQRHGKIKHPAEAHGFSPSSPVAQYTSIPQGSRGHNRAASVPKFGAWNEKDAKLPEGYTVIFNNAKGKKHMAADIWLSPASEPTVNQERVLKKQNASICAKILCCFSPNVKV